MHGSGVAGRGPPPRTDGACLKEIVVLRDPPTVHVYDIIESGRRHYRTIAFSSDASHSLASLSPRRQEQRATSHVQVSPPAGVSTPGLSPTRASHRPACSSLSCVQRVMGTPSSAVLPAPSLVISRQISAALGEQTYIPGRLLHGLLPTALLEIYDVWQQADDTQLRGYMKVGISPCTPPTAFYRLLPPSPAFPRLPPPSSALSHPHRTSSPARLCEDGHARRVGHAPLRAKNHPIQAATAAKRWPLHRRRGAGA